MWSSTALHVEEEWDGDGLGTHLAAGETKSRHRGAAGRRWGGGRRSGETKSCRRAVFTSCTSTDDSFHDGSALVSQSNGAVVSWSPIGRSTFHSDVRNEVRRKCAG